MHPVPVNDSVNLVVVVFNTVGISFDKEPFKLFGILFIQMARSRQEQGFEIFRCHVKVFFSYDEILIARVKPDFQIRIFFQQISIQVDEFSITGFTIPGKELIKIPCLFNLVPCYPVLRIE